MTNDFYYRLIKARVAETIIKHLFLECGYHVFPHGMEVVMPTITGKLNANQSEESLQVRQMPDFVVLDKAHEKLFYLEVKYRANGDFKLKDLGKKYQYHNAVFIIVTKRELYAITYKQLEQFKVLPIHPDFTLENFDQLSINEDIIELYKSYAKNFFAGVD